METESGNKWGRILLIAIGIIIIIAVLIGMIVGLASLKQFFMWLIGAILVLAILFLTGYIFYELFIKKTHKNLPETYRKKLAQTARLMKNSMLGNLYISGDEKHNCIKLGKFAYLRMVLPKQVEKTIPVDPDEPSTIPAHLRKPKVIIETYPVPIDCFVLLKKGWFEALFGKPIFILVKPQDHNYSSIFNDVRITGFNLVPLDSQFFTIDKRNLDVDIIRGLATNYIREAIYSILTDLDKITKGAAGLDSDFQKEKAKGFGFDIPRQMNQEGKP